MLKLKKAFDLCFQALINHEVNPIIDPVIKDLTVKGKAYFEGIERTFFRLSTSER